MIQPKDVHSHGGRDNLRNMKIANKLNSTPINPNLWVDGSFGQATCNAVI